ncbi:PepSY-associated TM helix domain-containing protein [Tenacibaculum amylolyticum]|uniref:PepSY-associated TM helix domain-containing protein n=1 Tax=Tenacibaculum amylolyticum TaxID=104269 RepID=UPI0038940158
MKNRKFNQWLWKWHFIAGMVSLPFILVLAVTGAIYLFKPQVEKVAIEKIQQITPVAGTKKLNYQQQWEVAQQHSLKKLNAMVLSDNDVSTEFISGRFGGKKSTYVNPYSGKISGTFQGRDTWMFSIRKLHGELLGGKIGTKIVELIASWMVVLIITGLYIWFPFTRGIKGVFTIRYKEGKRTFFRDVHAVTGFWISILLLIVLAGGFPWTDVFGGNFKWVQKVTNTGYPKTWQGRGLTSEKGVKKLTLDEMVVIAKKQELAGVITIGLPKSPKSTFSVSNKTFPLSEQKMIHFDQYSGKVMKYHNWEDVGVLMRARMWLMAFHQGQFGGWNWYLLFFTAVLLTIMSISAIFSYLFRKEKRKLGVPKVPKSFKISYGIIITIIVLGITFPLFGISVILILLTKRIKSFKKRSISL